MSRFLKKQGFTLIELMVVIVIIGVLASLAIPRFTDASVKAKVAEAPRVLASYESAQLAAIAEGGLSGLDGLIFESPTSKWWAYSGATNVAVGAASASYGAVAGAGIGGTAAGKYLMVYVGSTGTVTHTGDLPVKYAKNFYP
ncbi:MAG: type II secretion system GspH family protein [Chitinispirillales bacterium]|nr:type II secretion system GspH family protein [Chitinispirillales bacterium]